MSQPGGAALQDLGIVPQTIFFSIRSAEEVAEANREAHHLQYPEAHPRRFSFDTSRSATSVDGRSNRLGSAQPVDDLRRRLALVSTAAAPVGLPPSGLGAALPIFPSSQAPSIDITSVSLSTLSNSSTDDLSDHPVTPRTAMAKSKSRVHGKGVEVGKVAPAIGQDSTNVMGLFNVDARYRGDEDAVSAITHAVTGTPMGKNMSETGLAAQRFVSTYGESSSLSRSSYADKLILEGNDASIKQLLERVYLDSYRDPLPELGPPVPIGIPRRKALRTSFPPRERTPSRPEGTLIAHLVEHTAAITSIQVSPDQLFFATGSEDGTVKIWDTIRLEKNVTSRARQTFVQGGKITSVCVLENSHCVASASDNGTLWIHRVDVTLSGSMPRYSKPHLIRQQSGDGEGDFVTCLASYNTGESLPVPLVRSYA
jgi:phosphoinositide-3-kinase regulatory subunit 4